MTAPPIVAPGDDPGATDERKTEMNLMGLSMISNRWRYKIYGLRQHIGDDTSAAGVQKAAGGVAPILREFLVRNPQFVFGLDRIVDDLEEAGEDGDAQAFNYALAEMYDFCDDNSIWIALD